MTRRRRTYQKADRQREIIAALRSAGCMRIADRLQRCAEVRLSRRHGSGWPWVCRSAPACVWCGPAQARRWSHGIRRWIVQGGAPVSLAVLPLHRGSGGVRVAVARLRRALRDVRDRTARRDRRWRGMAIAGMAAGDGTAWLLIRHPGVARVEIADALRKRWPSAVVGDAGTMEPCWTLAVEDALELARARRGVEPLRVVVLGQRTEDTHSDRRATVPLRAVEPMPVVV